MPIVLILLVLGGLLIIPTLDYASTSLKGHQVVEIKALGLYAADAGIEDSLWHLKYLNVFEREAYFQIDTEYPLGEPVNGMAVTWIMLLPPVPIIEDGIEVGYLYTIKSTAKLGEETKGEIIAEIKVLPKQDAATGGAGGDFSSTENALTCLSITDPNTIIFSTFSSIEKFKGAADPVWYGPIGMNGLFSLDITMNEAGIYLDDDICLDKNPRIGSVHYECEEPERCGTCSSLLMSLSKGKEAGRNDLDVDSDDVFRLHVNHGSGEGYDADGPVHNLGNYIGKNVTAASFGSFESGYAPFPYASTLFPNANILFSINHSDTFDIGEETFDAYHVIGYEIGTENFSKCLDVSAILGCPTAEFGITALAPLYDGRLLLSFNHVVMESEVEGEERYKIRVADIAIWTPDGWECEKDEDGECIKDENGNIVVANPGYPYDYDLGHLGTITLHIDMHGPDAQLLAPPPDISIKSWQITM